MAKLADVEQLQLLNQLGEEYVKANLSNFDKREQMLNQIPIEQRFKVSETLRSLVTSPEASPVALVHARFFEAQQQHQSHASGSHQHSGARP